MTMHWTDVYVGLPFMDGGRGHVGVDCWGLVRLVYAEQVGAILPSYGEISADDLLRVSRAIARDCAREPWRRVTEPECFDVVVMSSPRVSGASVAHCGIMLDSRRMLHVERAKHACIERIGSPAIKPRLRGFYRLTGGDQRDMASAVLA